jgi:transposase
MPKLLVARPPHDDHEARTIHKLASSRHAPGDWIRRARMIVHSCAGHRTAAIAADLGCHPQTVRERLARFNAEGVDGLGDRPGAGRKRRLTELNRSTIIHLVGTPPPGRLVRQADGRFVAANPDGAAYWTLAALTAAALAVGIAVQRSPVRRILLADGQRWRSPRRWIVSKAPAFGPNERRSSPATPCRRSMQRPCVSTNLGR